MQQQLQVCFKATLEQTWMYSLARTTSPPGMDVLVPSKGRYPIPDEPLDLDSLQ